MLIDAPVKDAPTKESFNSILHDPVVTKENQQALYSQSDNVFNNIVLLNEAPLLTSSKEINHLYGDLVQVTQKRKMILMAGLCVEDMDKLKSDLPAIKEYAVSFSTMMQDLAGAAEEATGMSVVRIGRVAGQLAKPRSDTHEQDGTPVFRGPIFNSHHKHDRTAKGARLADAYNFSNEVRYRLDRQQGDQKKIYAAHEGLALAYERGLMQSGFAGSAPFLWIGNRTNKIDGEHVKFACEVRNPIGVKVDGKMKPEELETLVQKLNPHNTPGRLTLIFRMGAENIEKELAPLLDVVSLYKDSVIAITDPMHGNTVKDPVTGLKTRHTKDIITEAASFARQCRAKGIQPGGIHLEVSPYDVTECLGEGVDHLRDNYQSLVDPCLNPAQAKVVARHFANALTA
jgi:3-deoxy-7-phosphoheptulonate synthase